MQPTINNKHFTDHKSKSIKVDMPQNNHLTIYYFATKLHLSVDKLFNTESEMIDASEPSLDHRDFVYKG